MMRKYRSVAVFLLCMLCVLVTPVNAQNNAPAPTRLIIPTLENLSKNNQLKEGQWYSISRYSPSYKMRFYDLYEQYQDSVISKNVRFNDNPVQFIKVGDRYLPHIVLSYVSASFSIISAKEIPKYAQYVKTLEQSRHTRFYLDAYTKKEIPEDDVKSIGEYIWIKKNYQDNIDIIKSNNILYMAKIYDYYPDGMLKTETTYNCDNDPDTQEECVALFLSIGTYEQGGEHEQLSSTRIQLNGPEDIGHDVLRPLFMQNKVILEKLKKQK